MHMSKSGFSKRVILSLFFIPYLLFCVSVQALEAPTSALQKQAKETVQATEPKEESVTEGASDVLIDNDAVIEINKNSIKDSDITQRIQGIYSEISNLNKVSVSVTEGVVTLTGEVPNEAQAQTAARLAKRTQGVVAVQDSIKRTLKVQDNLSPVLRDIKNKSISLIKALPLLAIALMVFLAMFWLGKFASSFNKLWQRILPNPFVAELFSQALFLVFVVSGIVIALSILGAKAVIGTLLGGAGVLGIAVGFAVRDSIENYISSIMLSIRQPFRSGDHVVINDLEGIVVRLTSRATILMTLEGNHLRIPNSQVFKGIILNYTTNPERRFDFELGVDAEDDPVAAMKVGLDALKAQDFILTEPAPSAVVKAVGDSNIVISFKAWVNQTQADFSKARSLSIRSVKNAIEKNGFSLPEPIYRLRFDTNVTKAIEGGALDKFVIEGLEQGGSTQAGAQVEVVTDPAKEEGKTHKEVELTSSETAEVMDVRPDTHLKEKVDIERMTDGEKDLLDARSPKE